MTRHVFIEFEVDDTDPATREELEQQVEDVVAALVLVPPSWTYQGQRVLDEDGLRFHRLTGA